MASTLAWSPLAAACANGGFSAWEARSLTHSLLIVLLMSVVSLLSMRAASRAVARMRRVRDSRGLRVGRVAAVVGLGISSVMAVISGGFLLLLVLLVH